MFNKERRNYAWIYCLKLRVTIWYNIKKIWRWFAFEKFIQKAQTFWFYGTGVFLWIFRNVYKNNFFTERVWATANSFLSLQIILSFIYLGLNFAKCSLKLNFLSSCIHKCFWEFIWATGMLLKVKGGWDATDFLLYDFMILKYLD